MELIQIEKSCKYCHQTHKFGDVCKKKPAKANKETKARKFRNTLKWQKKRKQIKERDNYLCQICIRNLYNTFRRYNTENLQVHHNEPIGENDDLNLETSNLLTVCGYHHKLCDSGEISFEEVKGIIQEQN